VPPTPYYGRIMASARLRAYDIINNFQNNPDYFLELYKPWKKYDIVVFQKKFDSRALRLAQKLKKSGVKIILDINVNYYDRAAFTSDVKCEHDQIMLFTRIADGIITSTGYIEEYVKRLFPEKIITTIPENITDTFFSVRKKIPDTNTPLKLLYVGYSEKASEIMQIENTLRQLHGHHHFSLLLICDKDPKISIHGIETKYVRYRQKEIHRQMLEGDIFIAPRDMNKSYNLGHSFTKIGYPMSVGVPVIASTVPSYTGSPAILCENKADWYNSLDDLLKNRQKREILAEHGIVYCREHFSKSVITEKYISFFKTALSLK
jgi:glycosyltransferase involved in cell wall biosynthesis